MQPIHKLTSWIREYTQDPRHRARLILDEFSWYQLCTALDTVDDADEAISAYSSAAFPENLGERYPIPPARMPERYELK